MVASAIQKLSVITLGLVASFMLLLPGEVSAQSIIDRGLCTGANLGITASECTDDTADISTINGLITAGIDLFSVIIGVVAVFMIIFGGLKYIVSGGDAGKVSNAKNTILYAIVGLVIVALAQVIVRYVVDLLGSAGSSGGSSAADG